VPPFEGENIIAGGGGVRKTEGKSNKFVPREWHIKRPRVLFSDGKTRAEASSRESELLHSPKKAGRKAKGLFVYEGEYSGD